MRKLAVCAILAAAPGIAIAQKQAGITLGLVAGFNRTTFGGRDAGSLNYQSKPGSAFGVVVQKSVSQRVVIRSGFIYSQQGSERIDTADATKGVTVKLNYLQVPLLAVYSFGRLWNVTPFAVVGLQNGLKMSCKHVTWTSTTAKERDCAAVTVSFSAKNFDVAGAIGGGVNWALRSGNQVILDATWAESKWSIGADPKAPQLRNRGLAVRVGFLFPERVR